MFSSVLRRTDLQVGLIDQARTSNLTPAAVDLAEVPGGIDAVAEPLYVRRHMMMPLCRWTRRTASRQARGQLVGAVAGDHGAICPEEEGGLNEAFAAPTARSCPSCASGQSRHSGVPGMRQKATHFFHADLSLAAVVRGTASSGVE